MRPRKRAPRTLALWGLVTVSSEPDPKLARTLNNAAIVAFAVIALVLLIVFSVSSNLVLRGILAGLALMATTFWVMVLQAERRHFRRKNRDAHEPENNGNGNDNNSHNSHSSDGNDTNSNGHTSNNGNNTREVNPGE